MAAFLKSFGSYLPERVVLNEELAPRVGRTPEWIVNASGIRERRWAAPEQTVADLAVAAAQDCLKRAGVVTPGMLIVASGSGSRGFPGPAAEVAARLGMGTAPALDVPIASAGSLFGLDLARRYAADYDNVLVIGAEKMSAVVGAHGVAPLDPNTAILFGDGAGAALVSAQDGEWKILDASLHTDGQFRVDLSYDPGSTIAMNGMAVILQASRKLPAVIQEVLDRQSTPASSVGTFLLHQANLNLLTRVAKSLGVDASRIYTNVERYGNTSSASMLIAAAEWSAGEHTNAPIVLAAFGAGFHWGALLATRP
jgi:3-oxoacyl-[acyl-carrier-protein] synthase-3